MARFGGEKILAAVALIALSVVAVNIAFGVRLLRGLSGASPDRALPPPAVFDLKSEGPQSLAHAMKLVVTSVRAEPPTRAPAVEDPLGAMLVELNDRPERDFDLLRREFIALAGRPDSALLKLQLVSRLDQILADDPSRAGEIGELLSSELGVAATSEAQGELSAHALGLVLMVDGSAELALRHAQAAISVQTDADLRRRMAMLFELRYPERIEELDKTLALAH